MDVRQRRFTAVVVLFSYLGYDQFSSHNMYKGREFHIVDDIDVIQIDD